MEKEAKVEQVNEEEKKKINLLKEDYKNEWWMPSSVDNGSMRSKLLRIGCRPLKRKYLLCMKSEMDVQNYATCAVKARSFILGNKTRVG